MLLIILLAWSAAAAAQDAVVPKSFIGAKQPQATIDSCGDRWVTFGKGDAIYCVQSGGRGFQTPQLVATLPKLALGMRRGPRITSAGNRILISAVSHDDGNLYCYYGRQSWSKGVRVNDVPGAAKEGLHAMAAQTNRVAIVWLDRRSGKTELRGAMSHDRGTTWSTNFLIYRSPDGHICECCHPNIAFDPTGKLVVMWRNWLGGSRDMFYCSSDDDGKTFTTAQKLGTGTWPLQGCPMDGGSLAISADGSLITAWRRGSAIFCSSNDSSETEITDHGTQPVIASARGGAYLIWQDGEKLMLHRDQNPPTTLSEHGAYASIGSYSADRSAIVVWENHSPSEPPILFRYLQ